MSILTPLMRNRTDQPSQFPTATLLWGVAGALTCGSMIPLEPNLLEEGMILEIAQRLVHGDHLYQDVVAFTGPLPFEALALLFRVFGEEIWVARAVVALLHGAATAAAFALVRSTRADGLAHVAGTLAACAPILLFPLFSTYFYTTVAVSIGVLASWVGLLGLRDIRWAVVAGVLAACSALSKQTVGAVLAFGLLVSLVACSPPRARLRTGLALTTGGLLAAVVTVAGFAATGGVGALIRSLIELPLSFQSSYDSPLVNFWPPGVFSEAIRASQVYYLPYFFSLRYGVWVEPGWALTAFTQSLYAIPFIAVVATLARRWRGPLPAAVWIHLATLIAMISNLFPRADWGHLVAVLPSAAIQLVLVVPLSIAPRRTLVRAAAMVVGFLALTSLAVAATLYSYSEEPSFGPRVPLRVVNPGYLGTSMPHAISYIRDHTDPGDAIFVARAEPLIYFATDTRNPTPYSGVIPGMHDEQQRVIKKALETTRYVVMTDIDQPVFTYYRDALPEVQQTLERHFRIPDDFLGKGLNWVVVLERGPDRGATHTDLLDHASHGRSWIRARDGNLGWVSPYTGIIATAKNRRFLPIVLGARGGGIDFDVKIPEGGVFQAGVGYPVANGSDRPHRHPAASSMRLSIRKDDDFLVLAEKEVNPNFNDVRRWEPFEVDLSRFAGSAVTLRLELVPTRPVRPGQLAWWGSPRIAIRPNPNDS